MASTDSNSGYRVLALETRPQTLDALVGQENVRKVLGDMILKSRVPHALLLTGTRGTGKTSTARIFAKSLCCEQGPTITPCGTCVHCVGITASSHEDVLEIDGASNTGVDQIRELRESARFYPKSARYKVFIIDEVHMLSIGAFNALLKTLEEPPPLVVFVLATTEINKVPATVRSRCMVLPFRKVDVATLTEHLAEVLKLRDVVADSDALVLIAREARGSFRDALSLLEQALPYAEAGHLSLQSVSDAFGLQDREIARQLFLAITSRAPQRALVAIDQAEQLGFDFSRIIQQVGDLVRLGLVLKVCASAPEALTQLAGELLDSERQEIAEHTETMSSLALTECFRILQQSVQDMARSTSPRQWAELAILDCIDRSVWMNTDALLKAIENLPPPALGASSQAQPLSQSPASGSAQPHRPAPRAQTQPMAQISAPEPSGAHEHASGQVNLSKLRQWIAAVSEKAVPLGAKLRHAQFEIFQEHLVRLAPSQGNQLYGSVSATDFETLKGALAAIGFGSPRIEGFTVAGQGAAPQTSRGNAPSSSHEPAGSAKKKLTPVSDPIANADRETPAPLKPLDPFASHPGEYRQWLESRNQNNVQKTDAKATPQATASASLSPASASLSPASASPTGGGPQPMLSPRPTHSGPQATHPSAPQASSQASAHPSVQHEGQPPAPGTTARPAPESRAPSPTTPPRTHDQSRTAASPSSTSISEVDATEARAEFEKKRARILAHPFFIKLSAATDGLTLIPNDPHSKGTSGR